MKKKKNIFLDFKEGKIKQATEEDSFDDGSWPKHSVFSCTGNNKPDEMLGFGEWTLIGTQMIGETEIKYYKRTDK